jgi:lysophospholipase L1-like esterase
MNFFKKISLVFAGILISLVILEILLQISGLTLTTIKKYQNKKLKDPDAITILCLGESTTDGQWPPILQKILDTKAKHKKFRVIDEGHIAKNSEYLLYEIVEKKLNFYKPEVVISMIGANDATSDKPYIIKNTNFKLKTFSLLVLIKQHLIKNDYSKFNMAAFNKNIDENILNEIMQMAELSFNKEKSSQILGIMKKITAKYPDIYYYESMVPALINPYFYEIISKKDDNYIFSIDDFTNYYKISNSCFEMNKIYILFAKNYYNAQNYYNAVLCAKMAFIDTPDSLISVKHIIDMGNKLNINMVLPYHLTTVQKHKNTYLITKTIYMAMAEKIFDSGAQLIAMQYPTLPIERLKTYLNTSKYYDKIIFISNTKNFKETLKTHKIEDIFKDMFGGSFGHCTELGNTIIAENVAETILSLYDKE